MKFSTKIMSAALALIILFGLYLGAYKPLVKAKIYISKNEALSNYRSVEIIKREYNQVFNYDSPIGQREVIKFFITYILRLVGNQNQPEEPMAAIAEYTESKIHKDDVIHLLHMAYIYDALWQRFEKEEYFNKAEKYYKEVLKIGPRLPHGMEGLFVLYKRAGEEEKMKEMGERILSFWPNHPVVVEELNPQEVFEKEGEDKK